MLSCLFQNWPHNLGEEPRNDRKTKWSRSKLATVWLSLNKEDAFESHALEWLGGHRSTEEVAN
ncbi:hypothetical protein PHYBLDRAFT_140218 [Phycomyces blakesleeanus NRRL 1555(-)]|uniref:Uncharacterized protein n=1 Tax=Phycomyces blakesleeanus (strain ATCC 8743b / DSM 1359 / FGSC 10004 / NBRC 33097 / NRRL 1555) TaxID=763407 RepID=A0A167QT05_PHYB8|nr:hypothetical protein PHYBLDRAFT_140218 [Phycomyces blakesleeanus NRRL 1555(-)]OAD80217.1 hypothetical protein PHYBLDRAFT_140218 [Phycomyces blakesleeanus NRRL 1555(-)]|eukprot:XP_018298257.1 hypothetical protein PHYBLDRAFT_140218 [Phycomyces blakesleeanus NRRL 1555(-)]